MGDQQQSMENGKTFTIKDLEGEPDEEENISHENYFNLTRISFPKGSRDHTEGFPNAANYIMYLTLPLHVAMITVGSLHKDECPAEVRVPRYLFFGGLAGLMAILLRLVMTIKWYSITKDEGDHSDPAMHPGLSMVRSVAYIFIIFFIIWNINATLHIYNVDPNFEDPLDDFYCHETLYKFSFALVILFDIFFGLALLIWITAIVAGICNPDFLVRNGYFQPNEIGFKRKSSSKETDISKKSRMKIVEQNEKRELEKKDEKKKSHLDVEKGKENSNGAAEKIFRRFSKSQSDPLLMPPSSSLVTKIPVISQEDLMGSDDELQQALSIVRFAQVVNSRRISVDYHKSRDRLDITNFPMGPLIDETESETNYPTRSEKK